MEKVSLPIKTKIAAWWMIIIGGIELIIATFFTFFQLFIFAEGRNIDFFIFYFLSLFLPSLLFFIPAPFLLKKKKLAWWFSIFVLLLLILLSFLLPPKWLIFPNVGILMYLLGWKTKLIDIISLIPFILLLLDRKNFWKIAI
jgi:hypothetical protein